jgi:two-component system probable response regulator PhcQ
MQESYEYKKYAILYVDDEEKSLKHFKGNFSDTFRIYTATNAQEGLKVLQENKNDIGLLLTDQRMPGEKGVWLLERARQLRPQIIRMLATAYADMEAAIAAVNTGAIYKYIEKPWDRHQLENTLKKGLEFFMVQRERDQLLQEKMSVLHNMMIADRLVSLGLLASGLSHHIRNSMQAVRTFVDLAPLKMEEEKIDLNGLRNPDFWKEYYSNVQQQISRINTLLSELCAVSQPAAHFEDEVALGEVVAEVLRELEPALQGKGVTVRNRIGNSLPRLKVDLPKFRRLFELLLKDELATLEPGKSLELEAQICEGHDGRAELQIEVHDDGPGLPQDALRTLFDPFAVRADIPMEYGIHLMGCFFIVHHHGGRITATSGEGQGTTFVIRLPLDPNPVAATESNEEDFLQKVLLNQTLWEKLATTN